jgi:hypothetical protein
MYVGKLYISETDYAVLQLCPRRRRKVHNFNMEVSFWALKYLRMLKERLFTKRAEDDNYYAVCRYTKLEITLS